MTPEEFAMLDLGDKVGIVWNPNDPKCEEEIGTVIERMDFKSGLKFLVKTEGYLGYYGINQIARVIIRYGFGANQKDTLIAELRAELEKSQSQNRRFRESINQLSIFIGNLKAVELSGEGGNR